MVSARGTIWQSFTLRWWLCFACLAAGVQSLQAQGLDAFARVTLSKRHVYMQQPIHVTVSVYTATWFTQPLDFTNLQLPNAFIVPFSRTVPGVTHINGKQYSSLEFYYELYPYKAGQYEIPPLNITAYTPPEGVALGKKVTLKTKALTYTVRDVPKGLDDATWFVAKNVTIRERWNKPLTHVKVGDVLTRTITVYAAGTLPNFIPPLTLDASAGISVYPADATLHDQRDDYDANGTRTETITYLFEKEGPITLSPVNIQWWNPSRQHLLHKALPAHTLQILPNPNLGILASVRDSLQVQQGASTKATAQNPLTILGIPWKKFVAITALALVALYILIGLARRVLREGKNLLAARRQKERYWFNRFRRSSDDPAQVITTLYAWWDRAQHTSSAIRESPATTDAQADWLKVEQAWLAGHKTQSTTLKQKMATVRKRMFSTNPSKQDDRQQVF